MSFVTGPQADKELRAHMVALANQGKLFGHFADEVSKNITLWNSYGVSSIVTIDDYSLSVDLLEHHYRLALLSAEPDGRCPLIFERLPPKDACGGPTFVELVQVDEKGLFYSRDDSNQNIGDVYDETAVYYVFINFLRMAMLTQPKRI